VLVQVDALATGHSDERGQRLVWLLALEDALRVSQVREVLRSYSMARGPDSQVFRSPVRHGAPV